MDPNAAASYNATINRMNSFLYKNENSLLFFKIFAFVSIILALIALGLSIWATITANEVKGYNSAKADEFLTYIFPEYVNYSTSS